MSEAKKEASVKEVGRCALKEMGLMKGPRSMSREERLAFAREVADRALQRYGSDVKAIGLYGSMARAGDGPFSDIEMFCVLRQPGVEFSHEWSYGPGKIEVDFYGEDFLLRKAARVEGRWPLTHGAYRRVLSLYDPESFFALLAAAASSPTEGQFRAAIELMLPGEMYEFIGKVRNARASNHTAYLPELALQMAKYGAFLIGLHNRQCFTTGARVLEEALALPGRPIGFDPLAQLAMSGRLSDPGAVADVCEQFWSGVVAWAKEHGYAIDHTRRIPF